MKDQSETARLWFLKADQDLKIGKDEIATDNPATDAICFHMQQCVEKYLKGYLVFCGKEIERTHNIGRILRECKELDDSFTVLDTPGINKLTVYATELRYPDDFYMPSFDETLDAITQAETVRSHIREKTRLAGLNSLDNGKEPRA